MTCISCKKEMESVIIWKGITIESNPTQYCPHCKEPQNNLDRAVPYSELGLPYGEQVKWRAKMDKLQKGE